ncbi:hypothetical protein FJTKL_00992 [Diaporthe vaccinii]|uniref:Major facilitator superfamily (MFS) profile domain-containing protein n=1 Tax=Diaporthe vaccinii TaxID=105482 RepID=A0ABR4E1K4_9PEZI
MAPISVEKKGISVHESDGNPKDNDAVPTDGSDNDRRFDQALDFLKQHKNDAAVSLSRQASFTRALRRRVDFRVIPFLCCCYTLNFLDKVLLNYANIMGMAQQINLVGNEYSHAYADFWIASLVFSLPNVWLLNRLPVAKFLGCCLIGWGICNACHATLENYAGLVALRVLSGAFESGILPALILIASQYFTYEEQSTRFSFWYSGMGLGQIFGGLISFGFQHVSAEAALSGWKTMFLVLGLVTIAFGILVILMVPDTPMTARFLSNDDKVALLEHVKVNQTGIQNTHFHPAQLLEGLLDIGCWLLLINVMLQLVGSGVVTAYSATILKSFDYTSKEAALLNMPCGIVNIIATMCNATFVRFCGHRWLVVTFAGVVGTIGAGLLCFLPHSNKGGLLAGMYLINVLPGATIIVFQWLFL